MSGSYYMFPIQTDTGQHVNQNVTKPVEGIFIPTKQPHRRAPYTKPKIQKPRLEYSVSDYKDYQRTREANVLAGNSMAKRRRSRGKPSTHKLALKQGRISQSFEGSKEWKRKVVHILPTCAKPFLLFNQKKSPAEIQQLIHAHQQLPLYRTPVDEWWMIPTSGTGSVMAWARKSVPKTTKFENWGMKYFAIRSRQDLFGGGLLGRLHALLVNVLDGTASHDGIVTRIKSNARNPYPPKHLGYRCHYGGSGPDGIGLWKDMTTQDPASATYGPKTDAIKRLLSEIQQHIAPVLLHHMMQLDPDVFQFQQLIRHRLLTLAPGIPDEWPIDFGGTFFALAIAKGSGEYVHIDGTDFGKAYAIIVPTGTFTGGEFVLPTLGVEIPVRSGQFLAVAASFLPHYVKQTTSGTRYALTFFTDEFAAARARDIMVEMGFRIQCLGF